MSDLLERKKRLAKAIQVRNKRADRDRYEGSLGEFVREAWSAIDSSEYQESWALDALCEHLEAVTLGHIKRLLINFPPRCGKSNVASIAWPAWVWARSEQSFVSGPNVRFLCGSYNHTLSLQHSNASRRLLASPFYQYYWGDRFSLMADQNSKSQYDTDKGGKRIATSVGGTLVGLGGDVVLVDDPHNTESVESEAERETVLRWWKELSSTRLNDPKQSAIVVVMQRLHEQDVSGAILGGDEDFVHLMLPMRYDRGTHCVTTLAPGVEWEDPRIETGIELMWPERYGEKEVKSLETKLGPYMASGRLQQKPTPAGGGIFKEDWWGQYPLPIGAAFSHAFDFKIASLDPAYTSKQENDGSGFCVIGCYRDTKGNPRAILLNAWEKWLDIHGEEVKRHQDEPERAYLKRASPSWGLVEWVAYECKRHSVNMLLIENKASGHSVAQEIQRLYKDKTWQVQLIDPGSQDKRARAYSIQHLFASGMVEAPVSFVDGRPAFRSWAQFMIDQASQFRGMAGEEDNAVDAMTQCLRFMRDAGILIRNEERQVIEDEEARHRPVSRPLYTV